MSGIRPITNPGFVKFQRGGGLSLLAAMDIMSKVRCDAIEPRAQVGPTIMVATDVRDSAFEDLSDQLFGQIGITHPVIEVSKQTAVVAVIDHLPGLFIKTLGAFDQGEFIAFSLSDKGVVKRANDSEDQQNGE